MQPISHKCITIINTIIKIKIKIMVLEIIIIINN